jgi:phosphoribosylanthranilate isomerase
VAVFLHPSQALVDAAVEALQPDWLQADVDDLQYLRLPQGLRALPVFRSGVALPERLPPRLLYEGARSGQGERPDWNVARRLAATSEVILGGGLDAGNVREAVLAVRPAGVDVSSGVERTRGQKDAARMREFVEAARAAERAGTEESE